MSDIIPGRTRRAPRTPRRATLAGSPAFPVAPQPEPTEDAPKKRATRKRAPKAETSDE